MNQYRRRQSRRVVITCLVFALYALPGSTADVEVSERAGEAIGSLADAVREFRLTSLPAELRVQAQSMVFDYRNGELVYTGNVRVQHGEVSMRAQRLTITFEPEKPETLRSIEATGDVHVEHESETASGELAVYDPTSATITLTGDAHLGSGPNTVRGEKVVVFLDEGRATVEGGKDAPVRAHIEPKSKNLDDIFDDDAFGPDVEEEQESID